MSKLLKPYVKKFKNNNDYYCTSYYMSEDVIVPKNTLNFLKNIFFKNVKLNNKILIDLEKVFYDYNIYFDFSKIENNNKICLGGFFDEESLNIIIYINQNLFNYDFLSQLTLKHFWISIEEVLGHEIIHKFQFYKRGFIQNNNATNIKSYLSNKQEIMSFAWQCVDLFIMYGLSKSDALKSISNSEDKNRLYNAILVQYYKYFDTNNIKDIKVLNLFKKYIFMYINKML